MQASPRVDVDEAPYAPSTDLLCVTELEDAHGSIKLMKSDDNLEFFYTETLPMPNSDETSGQRERPVCVTCFLLSRSPVSSRVSFKAGILRNENQGRVLSDAARIAGNG